MDAFVSRAGLKLAHALDVFNINPAGLICADLGASNGGFTDCLLTRGASQVYAVEVGYGVLDWKLRRDGRVVVMERTNALFLELPEKVSLIVIDVAWTKQELIIPAALKSLASSGQIITLVKPHYEADRGERKKGVVKKDNMEQVLARVRSKLNDLGVVILGETESPIVGRKGGNTEFLFWLKRN